MYDTYKSHSMSEIGLRRIAIAGLCHRSKLTEEQILHVGDIVEYLVESLCVTVETVVEISTDLTYEHPRLSQCQIHLAHYLLKKLYIAHCHCRCQTVAQTYSEYRNILKFDKEELESIVYQTS